MSEIERNPEWAEMEELLSAVSLRSHVASSQVMYEAGLRVGSASARFLGFSARVWAGFTAACFSLVFVSPWAWQGENGNTSRRDVSTKLAERDHESSRDGEGPERSANAPAAVAELAQQPADDGELALADDDGITMALFEGVVLYNLNDNVRHRLWRDSLRESPVSEEWPVRETIDDQLQVHRPGWTGVRDLLLDIQFPSDRGESGRDLQ